MIWRVDMEQVYNPYLPSYEYVPDGEPRVFNDRLYVYGSHDRFNGQHTVWNLIQYGLVQSMI